MYCIWIFYFMTSWDENGWIINSRSSRTFILVLHISHKIHLFGKCEFAIYPVIWKFIGDSCFIKIRASLYYRFPLVLVLFVKFVFYQQYFPLRCSWICEVKQKVNYTGIYHDIPIYHHIVHIGVKQHILLH